MYVFVTCVCLEHKESIKGRHMTWDLSYRHGELSYVCWKLNLGPLQEQEVLNC